MHIYFAGRGGSGKDTLANYLIEKYNYTNVKFAHPVYAIANNYFNMKGKDRVLLNFIGTIAGRNQVNQDIWTKRLIEDLKIVEITGKELYDKNYQFVSTDTRFSNEHKILKEQGWIGIYAHAPLDVRIERLTRRDGNAQIEMLNSESERSVDEFCQELIPFDTTGCLEENYRKLDQLMQYLLEIKRNG